MPQDFSQWAILNADGRPICEYVGILSCSLAESSQVLTEPIEGGLLAAYNKVQAPDVVSVSLGIEGNPSVQTTALDALRALKQSVGTESLCRLVTPYFVVDNLALESISQARSTSKNATALVVELSFLTVRSVSAGRVTVAWSPRRATSAQEVNGGKVQPTSLARRIEKAVQ